MTREEYLESQRGKPYSQIVIEQPTETRVGSIRGDNLRNVVAILAGGLQYRLDNAEDSPLRTALLTVFRYLTLPDYAINLSLPENMGLLNAAVGLGLVELYERDAFVQLASYEVKTFNLTVNDCADYFGRHFNPIEFQLASHIDATSFVLRLLAPTPEEEQVRIEYRTKIKGFDGPWVLAAQLTVKDVGNYGRFCATIPRGSLVRAVPTVYPIFGELVL